MPLASAACGPVSQIPFRFGPTDAHGRRLLLFFCQDLRPRFAKSGTDETAQMVESAQSQKQAIFRDFTSRS